jgi:hypothetical protein
LRNKGGYIEIKYIQPYLYLNNTERWRLKLGEIEKKETKKEFVLGDY